MPAHSKAKRSLADRRRLVVAELAKELSQSSGSGQPRIIRNPMPNLGKVNLTVIWDKWYGFPLQSRTDMILEACEIAKEGMKDHVYLAIGRTTEEAISSGYLPFRIAVADHRVPEAEREKVEDALSDLGAVEISEGLQLRFANFDEAQEAFLSLQEKVPGPYWTIVEEVAREF
jgi:hypothetical protein